MTQSTPTRLTIRLCAFALLLLSSAPLSAAPPPGWQAVLVAGDNAEPVFDNAVAAVARWLAGRGVPATSIHRLSARQGAREAGAQPATGENVLQRIASLAPRPGDRCLVFITSHGQHGEGVWLAASGEFLTPAELARALSAGCAAAPTVVVVSSCYSGAFTRLRAPNRIVLTAARADRPSFGCQADRTYTVFDECLLSSLPRAATWRSVVAVGLGCVRQRERDLGVLPSQPQSAFGTAVRNLPVP